MKNSLFLKILKTYLLIVLLFTTIFFILLKSITKTFYLNTFIKKLTDLNNAVSYSITDKHFKDIKELSQLTTQLGQKLKIRITVIASDGTVLADSEEDPKLTGNFINHPEVQQALKQREGSFVKYDKTLKEEILYVATLVKQDGRFFILRTSYHLKDVKILINQLSVKFFQFLIVLTLIIILISFVVSRSIITPVKQLADATKKLSQGNFDVEIPITTKGELKVLAENFNFMVSKLKSLLNNISTQKDRINNIFASIQEAVVLLDRDGKILLYNEKFKQLCKTIPKGKNYLEVLISSEFNDVVKQAIEENKNLLKEIKIAADTYLCSISFISRNELVVLLYNITEYKQLQSIKKELVANIAHELKTPLTSIKGFAETLYDEISNKEHKHFLDIILANTNRLINIVNNLVTLSQLEHKDFKLEIERVDILELVNHIKQLYQVKIKEKGLKFIVEPKGQIKPIKADKFCLEQMLINLVDNSLKYTEKGFVKISLQQDENKTYIEVEDTGIGIPKEYHSRIFERFFVVDKARSRQTGGTGLGLSIVKHIVELHKGEIFLESQLGVGTKFKVVLNNNLSM